MSDLLAWFETADAATRAASVPALVAQWQDEPAEERRHDVERGLLRLASDPSLRVREALARAIAEAPRAPQPCLAALLDGPAAIATIALAGASSFREADLVGAVRQGEPCVQAAVARRHGLTPRVVTVLIAEAGRDAQFALLANTQAVLSEPDFDTMFRRFGSEADVRMALLERADCPSALRCELVAATATALSQFVSACGWMSPERAERVTHNEVNRAMVTLAQASSATGAQPDLRFIQHLRTSRRLTPSFLLRGLLGGDRTILASTMADLAGISLPRACGVVNQWRSRSFEALFHRAGLPGNLLVTIRHALRAQDELGQSGVAGIAALSEVIVRRVIALSGGAGDGDVAGLLQHLLAESMMQDGMANQPKILRKMPRPRPVAIDLDAIEAELCAA